MLRKYSMAEQNEILKSFHGVWGQVAEAFTQGVEGVSAEQREVRIMSYSGRNSCYFNVYIPCYKKLVTLYHRGYVYRDGVLYDEFCYNDDLDAYLANTLRESIKHCNHRISLNYKTEYPEWEVSCKKVKEGMYITFTYTEKEEARNRVKYIQDTCLKVREYVEKAGLVDKRASKDVVYLLKRNGVEVRMGIKEGLQESIGFGVYKFTASGKKINGGRYLTKFTGVEDTLADILRAFRWREYSGIEISNAGDEVVIKGIFDKNK